VPTKTKESADHSGFGLYASGLVQKKEGKWLAKCVKTKFTILRDLQSDSRRRGGLPFTMHEQPEYVSAAFSAAGRWVGEEAVNRK